MYRLTVRHHFDAAHFLQSYPGKCSNLHGHRWVVELVVQGRELDSLGMLIDFGVLKQNLDQKLGQLDHSLLNDLEYFKHNNPTAENLAKYIFAQLAPVLADVKLAKVCVYETPDAWAEYWEE